MASGKQLYTAAMIVVVLEAIPIPISLMGAVFALITPGLFLQVSVEMLQVWGVVLYPVIWVAVAVAVNVLASKGHYRTSLALTAIPPIFLLPFFVGVRSVI